MVVLELHLQFFRTGALIRWLRSAFGCISKSISITPSTSMQHHHKWSAHKGRCMHIDQFCICIHVHIHIHIHISAPLIMSMQTQLYPHKNLKWRRKPWPTVLLEIWGYKFVDGVQWWRQSWKCAAPLVKTGMPAITIDPVKRRWQLADAAKQLHLPLPGLSDCHPLDDSMPARSGGRRAAAVASVRRAELLPEGDRCPADSDRSQEFTTEATADYSHSIPMPLASPWCPWTEQMGRHGTTGFKMVCAINTQLCITYCKDFYIHYYTYTHVMYYISHISYIMQITNTYILNILYFIHKFHTLHNTYIAYIYIYCMGVGWPFACLMKSPFPETPSPVFWGGQTIHLTCVTYVICVTCVICVSCNMCDVCDMCNI